MKKNFSIISIRTNNRGEFDCKPFETFCDENSFGHNFSAPRTPQ